MQIYPTKKRLLEFQNIDKKKWETDNGTYVMTVAIPRRGTQFALDDVITLLA